MSDLLNFHHDISSIFISPSLSRKTEILVQMDYFNAFIIFMYATSLK